MTTTDQPTLPQRALDLRDMSRSEVRRLAVDGTALIVNVATTDFTGVPVQVVVLDLAGRVLMDAVVGDTPPSAAGAVNLHGITPQVQALLGEPMADVMGRLRGLVVGRTVLSSSGRFLKDAFYRAGAAPLHECPMHDVLWHAGNLAGTWNHTRGGWTMPRLPDALRDLGVHVDHLDPYGTCQGNAQRVLVLLHALASLPEHGVVDADPQDPVEGSCVACGAPESFCECARDDDAQGGVR